MQSQEIERKRKGERNIKLQRRERTSLRKTGAKM